MAKKERAADYVGRRVRSENMPPSANEKRRKRVKLVCILTAAVLLISALYLIPEEKARVAYNKAIDSVDPNTFSAGFQFHSIDVGQGDCELLVCDGKTMLIDGGEDGNAEKISGYLDSHGITQLDYVVATHSHSDHIGSLDEVLYSYPAGTFMISDFFDMSDSDNVFCTDLAAAVGKNGCEVKCVSAGDTFMLGSALVTVLGPTVADNESTNNESLVFRVDYYNNSFLLEGDAESEEEGRILQSGANVNCDVIKVGHHGSSNASSAEYLAEVTPEIAVINVGNDNPYGHPHELTLERISEYTDRIYRTDYCSDITITSDGEKLNVKTLS